MIKENEKDSSCPKVNLLEYDYPGLEKFVKELGEPPFRAMQVWQWIWQRMARDFEQMSNMLKELLLSGQKLKKFRNRQTVQPSFYSGLLMANMSKP